MWFVIVTIRSLFWILSSIGTFMLILTATFTPRWLISEEQERQIGPNKTISYFNTVGLYSRCKFSNRFKEVYCRPYATSLSEVSSIAWQCCLFFIGLALFILAIASLFAVASFCKQIIRRKSLMNLAGILQTIAGSCYSFVQLLLKNKYINIMPNAIIPRTHLNRFWYFLTFSFFS